MKILVINAGSSSMKYQLFDMEGEKVLAKGNCERIGIDGKFKHKTEDGRELKKDVAMANHVEAFEQVMGALMDAEYGVIKDYSEISAVGHRVVQGGSIFSESVRVNEEIIAQIETLNDLAPLHNPANIQGIRACMEIFGPDVPEIAVFDTAFHATMPDYAYLYPVPYKYYEQYGVRRYGFHGTSHRFVSARCAELLGKDIKDTKIITCHLGNGSSIAAIDGGKVIDTTMGLTPLDGFMMGTRCGSLDPSVVTFIMEKEGFTPKQMSNMMNKESGMLGISGISSDDRDVGEAVKAGNERAILTYNILEYQIAKYIGSYITALGGCDALVFTAGIGENEPLHRKGVCERLSVFGTKLCESANESMIRGKEGVISTEDSGLKVFVIPTNEELLIARDTKAIVEK